YLTYASHAATLATSAQAESGTVSGSATTISDSTASGSSAVKFGNSSGGSGLSCTNPVYSAAWPQTQFAGWDGPTASVSNDVQSDGTGPSTDSEQLNVCSQTNWNVVANWFDQSGSINAYPDTNFTLTGDKTVSQYNSLQTCFG